MKPQGKGGGLAYLVALGLLWLVTYPLLLTLLEALGVAGGAAASGWTAYPPLSAVEQTSSPAAGCSGPSPPCRWPCRRWWG